MPDNKFTEQYRLLGIQPGATWKQARSAYKHRIRQWHPDRYVNDEASRRDAEEHTKRINQAYRELMSFYEQRGRLPLDPGLHETDRDIKRSVADRPPGTVRTPHHPFGIRTPVATNSSQKNRNFIQFLGVATILCAIGMFLWIQPEADQSSGSPLPASHPDPSPDSVTRPATGPNTPDTHGLLPDQRLITVGSTLGEVYSIQGVPTRVDGDVWHYGAAQIMFANGRVTKWQDTQPPILKVTDHHPQTIAGTKNIQSFGHGSSKEEVRTVQGQPLRESDREWDYGLSRVYFDRDGRVIRWRESPLDPLRVK